jgi:hypothetical protein
MHIVIKKYEEQEEKHLKELFSLCFEDVKLLNILNKNRYIFAYSAFLENELVGVMFSWQSSFHPYCTYFRILVNPFYNSLNITEQLLSRIEDLRTKNVPLQTSVYETVNSLISTYKENGFNVIRRTYSPTLKVSDVVDYIPHNIENHQIKNLGEVLSDEWLMRELTYFVKSIYEKTHEANPTADFEIDTWRKLILVDDLVKNGSYIYLDKNEKSINAFSFLHESEESDSLELGWCGAAEDEHKILIPQLFFHQVNYAIKNGFQFIIGEFDSTDEYTMEVLNNFPFSPSPTWMTLQKE